MPEIPITARYYPTLSTVITAAELPDLLGFLKEELAGLLDTIYFKDLQYSKSVYGDQAFYSLRIVSRNRLDLELPGTGIFISLNPDASDSTISSFPITLEYEWPILAYLRSFNLEGFSFLPQDFYNLALQILKISEAQVVANAMNVFTVPENSTVSLVQQFINDLGLAIPEPEGNNPMPQLLQGIRDLGKDPAFSVFERYVSSGADTTEIKANINVFFRSLLPTEDLETYIRNLILPKFRATLALSAGIDFPRKLLQPVDPATLEVIPPTNTETGEPRAGFRFGEALFYVSTEEGINYNLDIALSSTAPAMIGNTGLILEIERLRVDLSDTSNIVEADNDGRPPSFRGVYAQSVAITLPKRWFDNEENHPGTTARVQASDLLIGTGGISGTLALTAIETAPTTITDFFSDCLAFTYPIGVTSGGTSVSIADYGALLIHLNALNGAEYTFDLPITVTRIGEDTPQELTTQTALTQFLNSCDTQGPPPRLIKTIGNNGFTVWFTAFDITFKQGDIVSSNIAGGLKIPKLKDANGDIANIDIQGHLDADGDFLITASEQDGFAPIEIPEVLRLYIQGVELGSEDGNFFIGTTAELEFTNPVMNKLLCQDGQNTPTRIALPAIRIYSNGNFEIVGGSIALPTNFGLCLGPVDMSITNLNFTSKQQEYQGVLREYKCWGFDGALNLDPLGAEVRGNGVKYCYTVDDDPANGRPSHSFIRISTIEVDIIIPGDATPSTATAIIKGSVTIPEPGVSTEYAGEVSLKLPKLGIAGSVGMRLDPKFPAFLLDASVELPTPIPLGATGLGVFGFRGLLGYRYVAEKEAVGLTSGEDSWYDYYTAPQRGINIQKFRGPTETTDYNKPISLGAGAAIATYGNDKIINFRVFVLLSIPSLFFIEGTANILAPQLALDDPDEPPFFAFLAIGDDSIEAGLGADFRLPRNSGDILSLNAQVEAGFFFNDPSAFYVNIGTRNEPITARLLSLLTAQTYLQLSAKGIEAGARAEFEFDKRYGPVRVRAYAYVEVGGKISFERPQIGGYMAVGGQATIDIKILSLGIGLDLVLGAEAARPFLIFAEFRLCVKARILFIKIKFCGNVELKWEKSRQVDRTPIPPVTEEKILEVAKGVHMLTGDTFDLTQLNNNITDGNYVPSANNNRFNNTVIPMDTYIDFKFEKPVNPNPVAAKTGGVNNAPVGDVELIPPQKIFRGKELRQVKHAYSIEDVELKAWNGSAWVDYNPYEALFSGAVEAGVTTTNLKFGHWQKAGKEYNALRILGDSPFSFTQLGEPGWYVPERLGITAGSLFCTTSPLEPECANWLTKDINVRYLANTDTPEGLDGSATNVENFFTTGRMSFWVQGPTFLDNLDFVDYSATVVTDSNSFGFAKSLKISNFMSVELRLPNPSKQVELTLSTVGAGVTLSFYRSVINDTSLRQEYALVQQVYRTREELASKVTFENADQAITRIIVQPDFLNVARVNELLARLEILQQAAFEEFVTANEGEVALIGTGDANEEARIQAEIVSLLQEGCPSAIDSSTLTGGIGQMQIGTSFQVGARDLALEGAEDLSGCTTLLHEVCWLSETDYEFNLKIPAQDAIQEDFALAEESIDKVIAPIWRPDTKYYLHLNLKDEVDNDESGTSQNYHYYYGFRTAGPVGHFHNAPGVSYGLDPNTGETNRDANGNLIAQDRFPLTNLSGYIDYQRSYPNADGNLLGSKPLFYANEQAKLQLFFIKPQTFHMFNTWEAKNGFAEIVSEMKVLIKDPVNDTIIPYPLPADFDETTIPNTQEEWLDDAAPLVPENVRFWNNLVEANGGTCVVRNGNPVRPKTKIRTVSLTNLKPRKLYTALVNNVHQGTVTEVHDYVFQTSRYPNFEAQVNSYQLDDGAGNTKAAIFQVPLSLATATIDTMLNIIDTMLNAESPDATNLALQPRFADRFDRVVEGLWGLSPLPVTENTEFNAVVDQNTGDTVALWIRNPEPFNDPKVPEATIRQGVKVLNNANDDADENYKVLHSKDYAQVLIMRNNKRITNTALRVCFNYLLWNGSTYEIEDTVLVENLNIL